MLLLFVFSEESRLRQLHFDAIASLVVILLVELEADEVALLFYSGDSSCSRTYEWVKNNIILVRPTNYMVSC